MEENLTPEEQRLLDEVIEETVLPSNSRTILINNETSRFSSAEWYQKIQESSCILAGVGGIGSYVAFLLGRTKIGHIELYDNDIVGTENMSGQLYSRSSVGSYKVYEIHRTISEYSDLSTTSVYTVNTKYEEGCNTADIMICGFDNMEARKLYFNSWLKHVHNSPKKENCLFVDGRLAAEEFQVFSINGADEKAIKEYSEKWLFEDSEADETICSYKQTSYCANMIASYMVNSVINHITNQCNPLIDRSVPYMISYDASMMYLKVIEPWQL